MIDISVEHSTTLSSVKRQKLSSYKNCSYTIPKTVMSSSSSSSINPSNGKIDLVTDGLQPFYRKMLKDKLSKKNADTVCDYIISNLFLICMLTCMSLGQGMVSLTYLAHTYY